VDEKSNRKSKKSETPRPGAESSLKDPDPIVIQMEVEQIKLRSLMYSGNFEPVQVSDVEFQPFEFFLDSLSAKFRTFLNSGIYVHDLVLTKEYTGSVSADDIMSFDIKRPTVFLNEIKAYLKSMTYLNGITGINVVGVMRDVWTEQVDCEK
jgi:NCK-associated protein 1